MGIPQGEISSEPVPAPYLSPDGTLRTLKQDYELGPEAVGNVTEPDRLRFQEWSMEYVAPNFILTPADVGSPAIVHTASDVTQMSFAFDQNGNIAIVYIHGSTATLYWFDPVLSMYTTWDLPDPVAGIMLSLDDKRDLQAASSDDIIWYTRKVGEVYNMYTRLQNERYTIEHLMWVDVDPFVYGAGMHEELRGQIKLGSAEKLSAPPIEPPGPPADQANLDFELGDVYWDKTGDFIIDQIDPYTGNWSCRLDTIPINFSTLENSVYTAITPGELVYVNCLVKGSEATEIILGFKFYNGAKSLIATETIVIDITTDWIQVDYNISSPVTAVYTRIFVASNNTNGVVSLDNFSFAETLALFTVELDTIVNYTVDLTTTELFEVAL